MASSKALKEYEIREQYTVAATAGRDLESHVREQLAFSPRHEIVRGILSTDGAEKRAAYVPSPSRISPSARSRPDAMRSVGRHASRTLPSIEISLGRGRQLDRQCLRRLSPYAAAALARGEPMIQLLSLVARTGAPLPAVEEGLRRVSAAYRHSGLLRRRSKQGATLNSSKTNQSILGRL